MVMLSATYIACLAIHFPSRYVAKVQQGAAIAKQQATGGPTLDAAGRRKKKEAEEKAARDLAALFAPVIKQPKPPPGATSGISS